MSVENSRRGVRLACLVFSRYVFNFSQSSVLMNVLLTSVQNAAVQDKRTLVLKIPRLSAWVLAQAHVYHGFTQYKVLGLSLALFEH